MAQDLKSFISLRGRGVWLLLLLTFIVSCSNGKQLGGSASGAPQGPSSNLQGTSDSGGGNGIAGKPLESYRFNPMKRPEFETYLAKLIASTESETKVLNNRLIYVLKKKNWYIVPVRLSELPAEKIGTSFQADQFALQNFDEIWIDQKKFEAMASDEERAKLLFHEIVMGLKILRFESKFNSCLSLCDVVRGTEADNLKVCEPYKKSVRKELQLSKRDYSDIRFVTDEVFARRDSIDPVKFTELLKLKDFDTSLVSYSVQQDSKSFRAQEIVNLIASNDQTGTTPSYSGFDSENKAQMRCSLSWELPKETEAPAGVVRLAVTQSDSRTRDVKRAQSFEFRLPDDQSPYEAPSGFKIGDKTLNTIELFSAAAADTEGGYTLNLDFENEQIRSIRILKFAYAPIVKPSCDTCSTGGRVSKFVNPRTPGNEPIFCYFEEKLPMGFDLFSTVLDQ